MELSKYQVNICKHLKQRAGNAAVVAVAGAGKTYSAIEGIGYIPKFYQVLLSAFNKDIKIDFAEKGRARGYKNVKYSTLNGLGWGVCLQAMPSALPILNEDKTTDMLELKVMRPQSEEDGKRFQKVKGTIKRLVSLFKLLSVHSVDEAQIRYADIVDHYNIDLPVDEHFEELLFQTFDLCIRDVTTMDYNDQVYMPIHLGLNVPCFDQAIVDEYQDVCQIEQELIAQACRGGQLMAIGDPDQSIYGFKGCDPKRFDNYIKDFQAKELPLSICYRCPTSVIEEAKKIVPRIEAAPDARRGSVDTVQRAAFESQHKEGDFVLCRVTEHLVRACLADIRAGKEAKVRGRDFGNDCISLLERVSHGSMTLAADKFVTYLFEYRLKQTDVLKRFRRAAAIVKLDDQCNTLHALAEGCGSVDDVVRRTKSIFCEDTAKHTGVDYATIHKSKGLQKKRVWILRPDLLPHPRSQDRDWMLAEEQRLKYVGITRAEEEFYWVNKAPGER